MARYRYRHTLDIDGDNTLNPRGKRILRAAFKVAERAHANQSRLKIDPEIQYISHPIMVYDIMRKLGENDPEVLAAAILHDAIEDHSVFRANDVELGDVFSKALSEEGIEEVSKTPKKREVDERDLNGKNYKIVDHVMKLCRQVTNPAVYGGDGIKENHQHERIKEMSFNAKKIKIADQAASLICNLTMANDPTEFSLRQEQAFTDKAHSLVVGIAQSVQGNAKEWETLKPWASFFGSVMLNVRPLIETGDATQKAQIRENFDFDQLFVPEPYIDILPKEVQLDHRHVFDHNKDGKVGLTWVQFDTNGNIARYALWIDWDAPKSEANAIQKKLTSAIRATQLIAVADKEPKANKSTPQRVLLMPGEVQPILDDDETCPLLGLERVFDLTPPLDAESFALAAKQSGALSPSDADMLNPIGDEICKTTRKLASKGHPRVGPTITGQGPGSP